MESRALCPLCNRYFATTEIETHAWACTGPVSELANAVIDLIPDEDRLACFLCGSEDMTLFHALEDCCHMACRGCLKNDIMEMVNSKKPSKIACKAKDCGRAFLPNDFRVLLDETEKSAYEASTMEEYVTTNQGVFVQCPNCQSVVERISSGPNGAEPVEVKVKGMPPNSPVPLTSETIGHYNECRFKCRNCETEFCSDCSESPYHVGYTCATFKVFKTSVHCRFCDSQLKPENTAPALHYSAALKDVCNQKECLTRRESSCATYLPCGHACRGIIQDSISEGGHLPCLDCLPADAQQQKSDYCNICWSEDLGSAPSVKLKCGHIFHYHCVVTNLRAKWAGVVITFGFLECPLCKQPVGHPALVSLLKPFWDLQNEVQAKALERFQHMNLKDVKELSDASSPYFKNPLKYALARFCYYPCFKCKKPYFGGLKECNAEQRAAGKDDKLEDLICGSCAAVGSGASSSCSKHGTDYIEYKCKFCCNVAAWYCWGSTHFCEDCHKKAAEVAKIAKDKLPKCTCGGNHPPNGEEHCLGCSLCRFNEKF